MARSVFVTRQAVISDSTFYSCEDQNINIRGEQDLTHTGVYHLNNWTDSVDCVTFSAVCSSGQTWLKLGGIKKDCVVFR